MKAKPRMYADGRGQRTGESLLGSALARSEAAIICMRRANRRLRLGAKVKARRDAVCATMHLSAAIVHLGQTFLKDGENIAIAIRREPKGPATEAPA